MVQKGHIENEFKTGIVCSYKPFSLVVNNKDNGNIGFLSAYKAFAEVYVDDLWVMPKHRKKGLARKLALVQK